MTRSHITTYLDDRRVSCGCFVIGVSARFCQCEVTTSCLDIVILFFSSLSSHCSVGNFVSKSFLFTIPVVPFRLAIISSLEQALQSFP